MDKLNKKSIAFIGFGKHLFEKQHWMDSAEESGFSVVNIGYNDQGFESRLSCNREYISVGHRKAFALSMRNANMFNIYRAFNERRLRNVLEKVKPNVVHVINDVNLLIAHRVATSMGIPTLTSTTALVRSKESITGKGREYLRPFFMDAGRSQNGLIGFQNREDERIFLDNGVINSSQSRLIPGSGINVDYFCPHEGESTNDGLQISQISRVCRAKGIHTFMEAADLVRKKHGESVHFNVYGESASRETTKKLKKSSTVKWHGHTPYIREVIYGTDIACLASVYGEGIPRCLLESLACQKPVVATNVAGNNELIRQNVNGIKVEPENAEQLANALSELILDPDKRRKMGTEGRKIVSSEYSDEVVNSVYRSIYTILSSI